MKDHLGNFSYFLTGILLLLPVFYAAHLVWQEYFRLIVITGGMGYLGYRLKIFSGSMAADTDRSLKVMLALVFMFVVAQFDPGRISANGEAGGRLLFLLPAGLVAVAFTGFIFSNPFWKQGLSGLDWVVIFTVLTASILVIGTRLFVNGTFPWLSVLKYLVYLFIWFLFTRPLFSSSRIQIKFYSTALVVFLIVFLVGTVRAGTLFYHYLSGEQALETGNPEVALAHYAQAEVLGSDLRFLDLRDACVFAQAEILYKKGKKQTAAHILDMEEGFLKRVRTEEWEGPAGGELYTHISCWKEMALYAGQIEVIIFARGQSALDVWPLMKVKLGKTTLGEVEVISEEIQPYIFHTNVETGLQRLEITFLNDYYQLPEDRNLWVEEAEIRYKEIDWR